MPRQAISLDSNGKHLVFEITSRVKIESTPILVRGIQLFKSLNLLDTWSEDTLAINTYKEGTLINKYSNFISKNSHINSIIIVPEQEIFVTGNSNGEIIVFKYDKEGKKVVELNPHQKAVIALKKCNDISPYLISFSTDNTLKVFNLKVE